MFRIGEMSDFIEGVDDIPQRDVIDFTKNQYGDVFCKFLTDCNCYVLNGRNGIKNDFTSTIAYNLFFTDRKKMEKIQKHDLYLI